MLWEFVIHLLVDLELERPAPRLRLQVNRQM